MFRKKLSFLSDLRLARRVRDRIRWDMRVSTSDLRVSACEGHVTLVGRVDSTHRKEAAREIVRNTEGVISIDDQISVPSYFHRTDAELKDLVEKQIVDICLAPTEYVSVAVADAFVKLEGIVHTTARKAQVAGIVWELSGVADCLNLIEIKDPPHLSVILERRIVTTRSRVGRDAVTP